MLHPSPQDRHRSQTTRATCRRFRSREVPATNLCVLLVLRAHQGLCRVPRHQSFRLRSQEMYTAPPTDMTHKTLFLPSPPSPRLTSLQRICWTAPSHSSLGSRPHFPEVYLEVWIATRVPRLDQQPRPVRKTRRHLLRKRRAIDEDSPRLRHCRQRIRLHFPQ